MSKENLSYLHKLAAVLQAWYRFTRVRKVQGVTRGYQGGPPVQH